MYCIFDKISDYKAFMCNHIDVNEPVLELVRIENSAFNKNFTAIK